MNMYYSADRIQTLFKFDKNSKLIFSKEYEKEFDGYEYNSIQTLKGELYLFGYRYVDKSYYEIVVSKISKEDGSLTSPLKQIKKFPLTDYKTEGVWYLVNYNKDSSAFIICSSIRKGTQISLEFSRMDKSLNIVATTKVKLTDDEDKAEVENVLFPDDKSYIVVSKTFDYTVAKKKRDQEKYLKNYTITKYDLEGKTIFTLNTTPDQTYAINSKTILFDNQIIHAEFYSKQIFGLANALQMSTIDLANGKVISNTSNELKLADFGIQSKGEDLGMENELKIKEIIPHNGGNNFLIFSESAIDKQSSSSSVSKDPFTGGTTVSSNQVVSFGTKAISAIQLDKSGKKVRISYLPKAQWESITSRQPAGFASSSIGNPWSTFYSLDYPLYSSYVSTMDKSGITMIFNDHSKNANITSYQDFKPISDFDEADVFVVRLDFATGKFSRKTLEMPTSSKLIMMPKTGMSYGNNIYVVSFLKKRLGKGEMVVSRIEL